MPVTGPMVEAACSQALHGSTSSPTRAALVSTAITNYVAQYAAGAPIDDTTGPFTEFSPTRIPQVKLGAGADPVVVTLTYVPTDGAAEQTQTATGVAGGTVQFQFPVQRITRVQSADPVDVMDIEAGDTMTSPAARYVFANTAGDVACRLVEDSADVTVAMAVSTSLAIRPSIIRSTGTTATVVLLW